MLVISRKPGQKVLIGDDVAVTVVRVGPNNVRLGIEAPRELNIVREELRDDGERRVESQERPARPYARRFGAVTEIEH